MLHEPMARPAQSLINAALRDTPCQGLTQSATVSSASTVSSSASNMFGALNRVALRYADGRKPRFR
jgi:hypothetical protein